MIQVYTHFVHRETDVLTESQRETSHYEAEVNRVALAIKLLNSEFKTWCWRNDNRVTVLCFADDVALFCLQHQELVEKFKVWESPFPNPQQVTNLAYPVSIVEVAQGIRSTYPRKLADALVGA